MALQPREKKLAIVAGALTVVVGAWLFATVVGGAFESRRTQLTAQQADIQKKRVRLTQAEAAAARMTEWQARSLPRNRELARSLYQHWLILGLEQAKLAQVHVDPGRDQAVQNVYAKLTFAVRARGTLEQVAGWLAAFHTADHLHKLDEFTLQPIGDKLQLTATVSALSLDQADRADSLTTSIGRRHSEADAKAAVKTIVGRNLFAAYVPPPPPPPPPVRRTETPPPPPPPPPSFNPAAFTVLTSIIYVNDRPQAWLNVRTTNETLRLFAGDPISIGQVQGKVVRVGEREIEIDIADKRRVIALGKKLTEGVESRRDEL